MKGKDRVKNQLLTLYEQMARKHGNLGWWPGENALEISLGAILTQNTSWRNAAKAIAALKQANRLSLSALNELHATELAKLIYSSGYYNQKSERIKRFVRFVIEDYGGSFRRMRRQQSTILREQLLGISGIGPETADSILLYALYKPVFVIDAYTVRIFTRLGLVRDLPKSMPKAYPILQSFISGHLPLDQALYNDFHAQLVKVGNNYCKPRPVCSDCPIQSGCAYFSTNI